jgi:hypothetical protein
MVARASAGANHQLCPGPPPAEQRVGHTRRSVYGQSLRAWHGIQCRFFVPLWRPLNGIAVVGLASCARCGPVIARHRAVEDAHRDGDLNNRISIRRRAPGMCRSVPVIASPQRLRKTHSIGIAMAWVRLSCKFRRARVGITEPYKHRMQRNSTVAAVATRQEHPIYNRHRSPHVNHHRTLAGPNNDDSTNRIRPAPTRMASAPSMPSTNQLMRLFISAASDIRCQAESQGFQHSTLPSSCSVKERKTVHFSITATPSISCRMPIIQ